MTRPARIGVQLPEVERVVRFPEYRTLARTAEAVGFDSVWLGDHLIYRGDGRPERGPWDVWTLLAAVAAVTERVTIGPLVACTAFHPPAVLAKMAASIDEIAGGRLVLGLGAGWNETEFQAFGIPFDHRVARFEECFAVIRALTAGERISLDGRFVRVADAVQLPPAARRLPLMVGSNGPRMLAATLPHVDCWNTWFEDFANTPDGFRALNARISAACVAAGRDPAAVTRSACTLVEIDGGAGERRRQTAPLTGSPAAIAAGLAALAAAGADEIIIVADPIDERSLHVLGESLALLDR
jgi:probable F420-dependent oxidoreductase